MESTSPGSLFDTRSEAEYHNVVKLDSIQRRCLHMAKAMKSDELDRKVRSGDWVAFKKDSADVVVAYGRTLESTARKVEKDKEKDVVYCRVPPPNCSFIL